MTVEEKALIWARRQKGNVLNNKNVDCFIAGYEMARKECRVETLADREKFLKELPTNLRRDIDYREDNYDHCGYYSYPESHIKLKAAYTELADTLERCAEYIEQIKMMG